MVKSTPIAASISARMKYLIPVCVAMWIFGNHYARDSVGSLVKQLEMKLMSIDNYATANLFFFLPNIFMPLIVTGMVSYFGMGRCIVYSLLIAAIGNWIFYFGTLSSRLELLYFGRFVYGSMYEVIDTLPISFLNPLFKEHWGLICGLLNSFLRLGSVATFYICPLLYQAYGLSTTFLCTAFIFSSGLVFAWVAIVLEAKYRVRIDYIDNHTESRSNEIIDTTNASTTDDNNDISRFFDNYINTITNLPRQFFYYTVGGCLLYGSMVPFWFLGSKYIQNTYFLEVKSADLLMLLPEGTIVIVSPFLGFYIDIDKSPKGIFKKLIALAISCLFMSVAYLMLVNGSVSAGPLAAMILLGLAYSFSNCIFWSLITDVLPVSAINEGAGLVGSAMNVLPSLVPTMVSVYTKVVGSHDPGAEDINALYLLSILAALSAVFFVMSALCKGLTSDGDSSTGASGSSSTSKADVAGRKVGNSRYTILEEEEEDIDDEGVSPAVSVNPMQQQSYVTIQATDDSNSYTSDADDADVIDV